MLSIPKLFPETIGQDSVKKQLAFYIEGFRATDIMPHLLFTAPKGCGKTHMAQAVARNLVKKGKTKHKPLLEINCASLKSIRQFFNQIVIPHVHNADVTVLFDECSELPKEIAMSMLTILNPNKNHRNSYSVEEYTVDFDFRQQTFIFCTTEGQSLFHALVDRLERIDLEEYENHHLGKIVALGLPDGVTASAEALKEASSTLRGNARSAQKMAMKIEQYCRATKKQKFTIRDWRVLADRLSIRALGLMPAEIRLLQELGKVREMRLTQLASKLGMSRQSVQYDYELYLQKLGLIGIETRGRYLTPDGRQYIKSLGSC
jgi:Holliday junction resolvasome RuvABC ATP-dependent DNA helicase subunit